MKIGSYIDFKEEMKKHTKINIDLDIPGSGGWTCLHYAAYMGHTVIASELIIK